MKTCFMRTAPSPQGGGGYSPQITIRVCAALLGIVFGRFSQIWGLYLPEQSEKGYTFCSISLKWGLHFA